MLLPRLPLQIPKGLSFDIPDLLLVQAWAEFHDLRMKVELDIFTESEEYEEMVGLFSPSTGSQRWMLWRSSNGVVAQPVVGRTRIFDSVAEALDDLIPVQD